MHNPIFPYPLANTMNREKQGRGPHSYWNKKDILIKHDHKNHLA